MSQENVEVVRRVAEVWNQSGWKGCDEEGLLDPDIEYHDDKRWPEARSAHGVAALVGRFEELLEVLGQDAKSEVERLFDAGVDQVVLIFHFQGEARASGIHYDHRWGLLCRVREGRLAFIQAYLEPEAALEAAGLSE
jgi:ketosteroid isomerase-like protein